MLLHLICKYRLCFDLCKERERFGGFFYFVTSSGTLCQLKVYKKKKKNKRKEPSEILLPMAGPSFRFSMGICFLSVLLYIFHNSLIVINLSRTVRIKGYRNQTNTLFFIPELPCYRTRRNRERFRSS